MLEKVDLDVKLAKDEYKQRMAELGLRLTLLQRAAWTAGIPTILVFEGWDASGKGTSINLLVQYMDPRGFHIHPITGATNLEKQMPWLWRFWQQLPNHGELVIFDRSWYGRVLVERVEKLTPPEQWRQAYQDIQEFEHTLAEDGTVLVKFFLHISKKEQKKRFDKLEKDPLEKWRVQKEDWEHHRKYKEYLIATEEMMERTEAEWANWVIVEATDRRWARVKILETVCKHLEDALIAKGITPPELEPKSVEQPTGSGKED
jgi:polyphosphate kinase 2 (PPK2 family)